MRRLALAITLGCVLSGMVRAGEIPTTGAIAPPPPPSSATAAGTTTTGAPAPQASSTALTVILTLITFVR